MKVKLNFILSFFLISIAIPFLISCEESVDLTVSLPPYREEDVYYEDDEILVLKSDKDTYDNSDDITKVFGYLIDGEARNPFAVFERFDIIAKLTFEEDIYVNEIYKEKQISLHTSQPYVGNYFSVLQKATVNDILYSKYDYYKKGDKVYVQNPQASKGGEMTVFNGEMVGFKFEIGSEYIVFGVILNKAPNYYKDIFLYPFDGYVFENEDGYDYNAIAKIFYSGRNASPIDDNYDFDSFTYDKLKEYIQAKAQEYQEKN